MGRETDVDGIFDRADVAGELGVDVVEDGVGGGGLSGADRPGNEDEAVRRGGGVDERLRRAHRLERDDLRTGESYGDGVAALGPGDAHPRAAGIAHGAGARDLGKFRSDPFQIGPSDERFGHGAHFVVRQGIGGRAFDAPAQTQARGFAGDEEEVAGILAQGLSHELF